MSVSLADQLVNLVWQKCAIDRSHFEDTCIITATNVLKQRMPTLLVKGQNRRHISIEAFTNSLDKGLALDRILADFIDYEDFTLLDCSLNGGDSDFV